MTLDELEAYCLANKPPALNDLSDNLVFGDGDPEADVIILGEAPGADEDEQGRPFVGRAGQLLDQILKSVELDRYDLYVTNIVKYRPPNNRNPTPQEIQASEPVLLEQFKIIRPQIIVTLGNVPSQYFLQSKEGITRTRGKFFDWQGIQILPMFHPAYLLRNPSRDKGGPKWLTWQDMKLLKESMSQLGKKANKLVIDNATQDSLF